MNFLATPTRRRVLFAALYLSEGAPIGFIWLALPTWLRMAAVPIDRITTLTALLVIPWTFKFTWAPLVDILRTRSWTLRHWIVSAQLIMGTTLVPLLWLNPGTDYGVLLPLLLVHAVAAATQDVAIDALCISVTDATERGRLNGWMQAGMLFGRAMFGGGALLLSRQIGQTAVVAMLIGVTASSLVLVLLSRMPAENDLAVQVSRRLRDVLTELRGALVHRSTWVGLLFAFIGGAAFKSLEVVIGPFLVDRGYSEEEIGLLTAGPMILLMIVGSLAGGWLADRFERRTFVTAALLAFVLPIVALALGDQLSGGRQGPHLIVALASTAFGIGLFTTASYALFMDLTRPGIAATQFSAFMGATNGCEAWSSYTIGQIIAATGYPAGLLTMCAASLVALPILRYLKRNHDSVLR